MPRIRSFPPILDCHARILILGSMPGETSLRENQYYAYPHNQFWRIMAQVFDQPQPENYIQKKALLKRNRIALWDVIAACQRNGSSLDSAITKAKVNDIDSVFDKCRIERVLCNGKTAFHLYKKHFASHEVPVDYVPSTSPAFTKPYDWKLKQWKKHLKR